MQKLPADPAVSGVCDQGQKGMIADQQSTPPRLRNDDSRCAGFKQGRDWMKPCQGCARRLAPLATWEDVSNIAPPLMVSDVCLARIPA